jgi:hypothetical protein
VLKEFISLSLEAEAPDNIPTSNDFVYDDDHFNVHYLLDHKVALHPQTYAKCPALSFRVEWEGYDSSEDS